MGDAVWFFHHSGAQNGPTTWSSLQEHAARGELDPDDLVWQPEMSDWQPAKTMEGLFPELTRDVVADQEPPTVWSARTASAKKPGVMAHLKLVESALQKAGGLFESSTLDQIDRVAARIGHLAYICGAGAAVVVLVVIGIKNQEFASFLLAVITFPVALLLGYSAARTLGILRSKIGSSPTELGATGFLDAVAAAALGIGLITVFLGLTLTVAGAGTSPFLMGLGVSLVLFYSAAAALRPSAINVRSKEKLANDDQVIAPLRCLAKLMLLRLAPIVFMVAAVAAVTQVVRLLVVSFGDTTIPVWVAAWVWGRALSVALLPMAIWLLFLMVWTTLEVAASLIGGDSDRG